MNDAVVLIHESLRQREAQSAAPLAARDERMENPFLQRFGHAGTIVDDLDDQSMAIAAPRECHLPQDAGAKTDLPSSLRAGRERLCSIARDIEHDLNQLLLVTLQERKAHVVIATNRDALGKLRDEKAPNALQDLVHIDGTGLRQAMRRQQAVHQRLQA